jgi:hypothetical protein
MNLRLARRATPSRTELYSTSRVRIVFDRPTRMSALAATSLVEYIDGKGTAICIPFSELASLEIDNDGGGG